MSDGADSLGFTEVALAVSNSRLCGVELSRTWNLSEYPGWHLFHGFDSLRTGSGLFFSHRGWDAQTEPPPLCCFTGIVWFRWLRILRASWQGIEKKKESLRLCLKGDTLLKMLTKNERVCLCVCVCANASLWPCVPLWKKVNTKKIKFTSCIFYKTSV